MRILFKDSNQVAMLPVIFFFLLFKASLFGSLFYGFNRESSRYLYLTKYLQPLRFWCCNTVSVECQLHSKMLAEKWTDLVLCARVRWISSRCAVMCCCFDAITRREHGNILQPVQIMFLWNWRQCGEAGTSKRRKNCVCSSRLGYKICTVNVYYVWNMRQYLHSHVSIFIVITFFLLFAHILLTFIFFCCVCAAPFGSAIRCKDVRTRKRVFFSLLPLSMIRNGNDSDNGWHFMTSFIHNVTMIFFSVQILLTQNILSIVIQISSRNGGNNAMGKYGGIMQRRWKNTPQMWLSNEPSMII